MCFPNLFFASVFPETLKDTEAAGDPVVTELGQHSNVTRWECCQLCTADTMCEMFAFGNLGAHGPPGNRATCWLTDAAAHHCLLGSAEVTLLLAGVDGLCSTEIANPWETWLPR